MGFGFDVLTSSGDCIAMLGGDLKHLLFLSFVGEMIQFDKHVIFQRYVVFFPPPDFGIKSCGDTAARLVTYPIPPMYGIYLYLPTFLP